jgi:hypothetical protein
VTPVTGSGSAAGIVLPSPSWPVLLSPQAHTVPSVLIARAAVPPAAIAVTLLMFACSGVFWLFAAPALPMRCVKRWGRSRSEDEPGRLCWRMEPDHC